MIFLFNWFSVITAQAHNFVIPLLWVIIMQKKEIKEGVFCHPIALCEIKFHIQSAGKSFWLFPFVAPYPRRVIFNICPATFSLPSDCSSLDKYGKRKNGGEREREKERPWTRRKVEWTGARRRLSGKINDTI